VRTSGVADVLARIVERRRERLAAEGHAEPLGEALGLAAGGSSGSGVGREAAPARGGESVAAGRHDDARSTRAVAPALLTAAANRFLAALRAAPRPAVIAE
jgi:hypothetical protein